MFSFGNDYGNLRKVFTFLRTSPLPPHKGDRTSVFSLIHFEHSRASQRACSRLRAGRSASEPRNARSPSILRGSIRRDFAARLRRSRSSEKANSDRTGDAMSMDAPDSASRRNASITRSTPVLLISFTGCSPFPLHSGNSTPHRDPISRSLHDYSSEMS